MKIFDCFIFNDENDILEIRLNELDIFVDFFIIVEFGENHQGNFKGKKINQRILENFKKKVRYFYYEKFDLIDSWKRESFQRNKVLEGLKDASKDDIIMISDVDEIPKLEKFNFYDVDDIVFAFSQDHSMYKLNLTRKNKWIGTKLCKKKIFKSPQWLRSLKVHKNYPFYRIDKYFSNTYYSKFKIIKDGGWHFGWLKTPSEIIDKIKSYAHTEHNIPKYRDIKYIENCIEKKISFLDQNDNLNLNNEINYLPKYIMSNIGKFEKWLGKK